MKILLLNLSPKELGTSDAALTYVEKILNQNSIESVKVHIKNAPQACMGCGVCKGGGCVSEEINELRDLCLECDAFIFAAPTHYATACATATGILSRLFYSSISALRHKPAFAIAVARRGGGVSALSAIEGYMKFANMPIASGVYPCIIYARQPSELSRDKEGLQNIRSNTEGLIWLTKSILAARGMGIMPPKTEPKIKTDLQSLQDTD